MVFHLQYVEDVHCSVAVSVAWQPVVVNAVDAVELEATVASSITAATPILNGDNSARQEVVYAVDAVDFEAAGAVSSAAITPVLNTGCSARHEVVCSESGAIFL